MVQKALFFLAFPFFLFSQINRENDFQYWNREILRKNFNEKWASLTTIEFRWGDNARKLYYTYLQSQIVYSPAKWISFAPGYRQIWRRFPLTSHNWEPEYSPLADLTLVIRPAKWQFQDRNRVQYLIFESNPSHWVYRNRFRIVFPFNFSSHKINPFVDNEIFIRQRFGFNQDRLSGGFLFTIYRNLSGELFYMARFQKNPITGWRHQNVLATVLSLTF